MYKAIVLKQQNRTNDFCQCVCWILYIIIVIYNYYIGSQFKMNRKQSHEPLGSFAQSQNSKVQYQVTSPYIQLLQSKKKAYGFRYDTKNIRSFTNYIKPSPASISSIFAQGPKPFKAASGEKVKVVRATSTNEKKKRSRTEQAQQKMHESMCVYPSIPDKSNQDHVSKSVYYAYPENKQSNDFQPNQYFQQLTGQKNKKKRHLSQNKHQYSDSNNNLHGIGSLQSLQISDIDGLLSLIDNCVSQANQYISYLSEKLASIKEELIFSKNQIAQMEQQIYGKDLQIVEKNQIIKDLQKQIRGKQIVQQNDCHRNLLQIIQKISQQNQKLRNEMQQIRYNNEANKQENDMENQMFQNKQKDATRDYFNQIHSKIDILNISIGNNKTINNKNQSFDRDRKEKDPSKKYKFIKPKGR